MKYWLIKGSRIWGMGRGRDEGDWVKGGGGHRVPSPLQFSEPTSHLSKEFNLLFVWGLFHSSTADHSLWGGEGKQGSWWVQGWGTQGVPLERGDTRVKVGKDERLTLGIKSPLLALR